MSMFRLISSTMRPLVGALFLLVIVVKPAFAADLPVPTYLLHIDGLACPFCAYGLEKQLTEIPDIDGIETDIEAGTIRVTMAAGRPLDAMTAAQAVEDAGFSLREFESVTSDN